MSDHEIMVSAGLYEKDFVTGEQGYNLAAIMLFGKDEVIRSCVPGYITDALYRVDNVDRYDDRLRVTTNLIESYEQLMGFVAKHTSDKFCLIDNVSTSVRDMIAREVVANILVHRDFSSSYPAKLVIEKNWLYTENWCRPRRHGNITSKEFTKKLVQEIKDSLPILEKTLKDNSFKISQLHDELKRKNILVKQKELYNNPVLLEKCRKNRVFIGLDF